MKENNENYMKTAIGLVEWVIVVFAVMIATFFYFGFNIWDFHIPITYDGGDPFASIANMKMRICNDEYRMGWPFYEDVTAYKPVFNGLYRVATEIIKVYEEDFFVAQNIFLFFIPVVNVVFSYYVFKNMKIRRWISAFGAFIFGFSPYVQLRLFSHQDLAAVECIPLVFLICFWLLEDESFAKIEKGYFNNKKNILLIFLGWMIANNGIIYYPFFSCFIILVTGIMIGMKRKNFKFIAPSIIVIINIVFWIALGFIPAIIGAINGRGEVATNGTVRDAYRSTVFGLDIKTLLLSPHGFGFNKLTGFYDYLLGYAYEQYYAYIGIVGIIGFIILIISLLCNRNCMTERFTRIIVLSRINVMLILLGTSCGLGVIVALFVPFISSYNRVSIFILFACVCTVLLLMEEILDRISDSKKKIIVFTIVAVVFFLYSLWEQRGCYTKLTEQLLIANAEKLEHDKNFFLEVESSAGDDSLVYVLPYMRSFEHGGEVALNDYEHYRGYMNTKTVRWSYGAIIGSQNDIWNEAVSKMNPDQMVCELKKKDFSGICINLAGFEIGEGSELLYGLLEILGDEDVIIHNDGTLVYIPINRGRK